MYLGSWKIDDLLTFPANTYRYDTGAAADADGTVDYRIYEDETTSPILTGSLALLDGSNTVGFYTERITLSAANGFEKGKCYTIYIVATVNTVVMTQVHTLQIEAEVDTNTVSAGAIASASFAVGAITSTAIAAAAIGNSQIATDAIGAAELAASAVTEIQAGLSTLDAAGVRSAVGLASANLDTQLAAIQADTDAIEVDTQDIQSKIGSPAGASLAADIAALNNLSAAQVNAEVVDVLRVDTIPDSYSVDGAQPTIAQALLEIRQFLTEKSVSGTTVSVTKPNGTVVMQFTINSSTAPTSITRAS